MRWSLHQPRGEQAAPGPQQSHGTRHPVEWQAARDVLGEQSLVVNGVSHPTIMFFYFILLFQLKPATKIKPPTSLRFVFCRQQLLACFRET